MNLHGVSLEQQHMQELRALALKTWPGRPSSMGTHASCFVFLELVRTESALPMASWVAFMLQGPHGYAMCMLILNPENSPLKLFKLLVVITTTVFHQGKSLYNQYECFVSSCRISLSRLYVRGPFLHGNTLPELGIRKPNRLGSAIQGTQFGLRTPESPE